ncbi:MAG: hypothetical protein ACPG6B_01550 [Oceanihabitans sp.]
MKKVLILFLTIATLSSCKNENKNETTNPVEDTITGKTEKQKDGLTLLKGEFIYYADAAVLQTHTQIYGVVLNDKIEEINKQAKAFQKEATDFVMVEVRGKISAKPEGEEGWDNRIEIKEILNVSALNKTTDNVVKLEK